LIQNDISYDNELIEIIALESKLLAKQQSVSYYESLYMKLRTIKVNRDETFSKERKRRLNKIKDDPLLKNKEGLVDKYSEQLYHSILYGLGDALYDEKLINEHINHLQKLINDPKATQNLNDYNRTSIIFKLIYQSIRSKDFVRANENIKKYGAILDNTTEINAQELIHLNGTLLICKIDYHLSQDKIEPADEVLNEIEHFLRKYGKKIKGEYPIVLMGNCILFSFKTTNYKKVLKLSNELNYKYNFKLRQDISLIIQLAEVISCFELDELDLAESRLNSLERYMENKGVQNEILPTFVSSMKELLQGKKTKDILTSFKEIVNINPTGPNLHISDLLNSWISSHGI